LLLTGRQRDEKRCFAELQKLARNLIAAKTFDYTAPASAPSAVVSARYCPWNEVVLY